MALASSNQTMALTMSSAVHLTNCDSACSSGMRLQIVVQSCLAPRRIHYPQEHPSLRARSLLPSETNPMRRDATPDPERRRTNSLRASRGTTSSPAWTTSTPSRSARSWAGTPRPAPPARHAREQPSHCFLTSPAPRRVMWVLSPLSFTSLLTLPLLRHLLPLPYRSAFDITYCSSRS
jgi:hypothetical protein